MVNLQKAEDRLNQKYLELCEKYNLNPTLLKDILIYRNRGLKNVEIAQKIGVTSRTVNDYVSAIKKLETDELLQTILYTTLFIGGAYLLSELLKGR